MMRAYCLGSISSGSSCRFKDGPVLQAWILDPHPSTAYPHTSPSTVPGLETTHTNMMILQAVIDVAYLVSLSIFP